MEKEEKNQKATTIKPAAAETEFILQWGNRKRLRCVRVRGPPDLSTQASNNNTNTTSRIPRKTFFTVKHAFFPQPSTRLTRNSETTMHRSETGKSTSGSPERYYTTRGSMVGLNGNGKNNVDAGAGNQGGVDKTNNNANNKDNNSNNYGKGVAWPKIFVTLSSKEKEEDFMAMKGCKLPQRPKKRAKVIQRTLLLVSPGAWLTDMSVERYEVREKSSRKRPRGLKAMGSIDSDSE